METTGSRYSGDGGRNSYSTLAMHDPRNPRIDTIINTQAQQSSNSSGFDNSSPASLDFSFPFGGSPHDSSNSGIDAPPDLRAAQSQGFPTRGSMSGMPGPQHRGSLASIDSAFDPEMMNSTMNRWTSADHSANRAVSNSDDSSRKLDQQGKDDDDENRPAWSELKTKAGKERKRLPLACIACRRKKIRCSGEKPACKHCLRARVPCVYKVTTRKAAPRTDYMAMLDKRLKRMEDRVIKVIPKEELPYLSTTGRASVRPPLPGQTPKKDKAVPGKKRSADEAFTQELSDWTSSRERVSLLDPSTGLRKQREGENQLFIEGSESLPPQHIQEHLAEVFFDCVYGQSYLLLHKPSFMRKLKAGTVPPVLILAVCAIAARFSTHPQVSTEPAFLRGEQWATPARRIIEKRHYEPNITILIAMIMLGLHYFGTCEGGLSWSFGGQAMRMGYALQLHRELDHDPLGRNQIAAKSTDPSRPSTDSTKSPELSFIDREIRRRTMWACYLMDTFNSSGTERPSFLNEDYFQIQLPITESHFQMEVAGPTEDLHGNTPMAQHNKSKTSTTTSATDTTQLQTEARSNMGVAAYIVRAVVLWKRIVKYLNLGGKDLDPHPIWDPLSTFSTLARNITTLKSSLPSTLTYTPSNLATHTSSRLANQFLFLHITLAQTSLFLHRFAIPTTPTRHPHALFLAQGMPKAFLTQSAQTVLGSAQNISELIASSSGLTLTVPFAGYCAYASATVHVWGVFGRIQQQQQREKGQGTAVEGGVGVGLEERSKELLRVNYRYLTRMKRYWGMFHYMAESVKDVYRVFADASLRYSKDGQKASLVRMRSGASAGGEEGLVDGGAAEGSGAATPGSHSQNTSAGSTKQMFQYGDWFDKYPHGVSEAEWESSHLEFRREGDKGSEAVMSQRSELQSVEEFFATLSPPSKGEEGKGRKRRRGKSLAEGIKKEGGAQQGQRASVSGDARPEEVQKQQSAGDAVRPAVELAIAPAFSTEFDMTTTSPTLYQNPQSVASTNPLDPGFSPTASSNFNYNYPTPIPNLDRQFVMGAYAGVDPSTTSAVGMSSGNAFGQGNAWDALDTFTGYGAGDGFGMDNGMGSGSSAWFMPFNMEPPNFAGMGDELGGGALDGMDFNDLGGTDQASFPTQSGPGGQA